jgi:HD-like signal output (HDOD) protein
VTRAETDDKRSIDDAFAAGLLHDAGRLVLAVNFPDAYRSVLEQAAAPEVNTVEVERRRLGATHAEAGACLIGLWGLPSSIIEALAWHHAPGECVNREFSSLTAVHVACTFDNYLTTQARDGLPAVPSSDPWPGLDLDYLEGTGRIGRLAAWRDACTAALLSQEGANRNVSGTKAA